MSHFDASALCAGHFVVVTTETLPDVIARNLVARSIVEQVIDLRTHAKAEEMLQSVLNVQRLMMHDAPRSVAVLLDMDVMTLSSQALRELALTGRALRVLGVVKARTLPQWLDVAASVAYTGAAPCASLGRQFPAYLHSNVDAWQCGTHGTKWISAQRDALNGVAGNRGGGGAAVAVRGASTS